MAGVAKADTARRLPVQLDVDPCTGVNPDVVGRVLTVELGVNVTTVDVTQETAKQDTTIVSLTCSEGTTFITVHDPISGKMLQRHVDLRSEAANARPRLLSLSAAELVAASWMELAAPSAVNVPIVEAAAAPQLRSEAADAARAFAARRQPLRWDAELVGIARNFREGDLWMLGGGAAGTWLAYRDWLAVGAGLRQRLGLMTLELGGGMRIGIVRLAAVSDKTLRPPSTPHTFRSPWGGPFATARVLTNITRGTIAFLSGEAGLISLQTTGLVDGNPELDIKGSWVALSIGVGLAGDSP